MCQIEHPFYTIQSKSFYDGNQIWNNSIEREQIEIQRNYIKALELLLL